MLCALEANLSVTTPRVETTEAVLSSAQTGFPILLTAGNCPLPQLTEVQARCLSCCLLGYVLFCLSKMASGRLPSTQVASV